MKYLPFIIYLIFESGFAFSEKPIEVSDCEYLDCSKQLKNGVFSGVFGSMWSIQK